MGLGSKIPKRWVSCCAPFSGRCGVTWHSSASTFSRSPEDGQCLISSPGSQAGQVRNNDVMLADDLNDVRASELRELAADGFDRQAQIIGDVHARERQVEGGRLALLARRVQVPGDHYQKAREIGRAHV